MIKSVDAKMDTGAGRGRNRFTADVEVVEIQHGVKLVLHRTGCGDERTGAAPVEVLLSIQQAVELSIKLRTRS